MSKKKGLVLKKLLIERLFFSAAAAVVIIVFVTRACSVSSSLVLSSMPNSELNDELYAERIQTPI